MSTNESSFPRLRRPARRRRAKPTLKQARRSLACYRVAAVRELYGVARIVGLDVGERRIGIAVSDVSGTLARPVGVVAIARLDAEAVTVIRNAIAKHVDAEDGVGGIVVGLPRHL